MERYTSKALTALHYHGRSAVEENSDVRSISTMGKALLKPPPTYLREWRRPFNPASLKQLLTSLGIDKNSLSLGEVIYSHKKPGTTVRVERDSVVLKLIKLLNSLIPQSHEHTREAFHRLPVGFPASMAAFIDRGYHRKLDFALWSNPQILVLECYNHSEELRAVSSRPCQKPSRVVSVLLGDTLLTSMVIAAPESVEKLASLCGLPGEFELEAFREGYVVFARRLSQESSRISDWDWDTGLKWILVAKSEDWKETAWRFNFANGLILPSEMGAGLVCLGNNAATCVLRMKWTSLLCLVEQAVVWRDNRDVIPSPVEIAVLRWGTGNAYSEILREIFRGQCSNTQQRWSNALQRIECMQKEMQDSTAAHCKRPERFALGVQRWIRSCNSDYPEIETLLDNRINLFARRIGTPGELGDSGTEVMPRFELNSFDAAARRLSNQHVPIVSDAETSERILSPARRIVRPDLSKSHQAEATDQRYSSMHEKEVMDLLRIVRELRARAKELLFQTRLRGLETATIGSAETGATYGHTLRCRASSSSRCTDTRRRRSISVSTDPTRAFSLDSNLCNNKEVAGGSTHTSNAESRPMAFGQQSSFSGASAGVTQDNNVCNVTGWCNTEGSPALKRQRRSPPPTESKANLPCIFFRGEPSKFPGHVEKYEYISGLLRHLEKHNFYACQRCFQKFDSKTSLDDHKGSCFKACSNRSCKRRVTTIADRSSPCICVTTAEDQWQNLYHLQYPTGTSALHDNIIETLENPFSGPALDGTPLYFLQEDLQMHPEEASSSDEVESAPVAATTPDQLQTLTAEVQMLRQQIQILEQRVSSQPTGREEDLEMTLANVWEGLCRSGSREAQPEGSLWRLVRRHAPSVLSTSVASQPQTFASQPWTGPVEQDVDWGQFFSMQEMGDLSKAAATDSGYGTAGAR